MDTSARRLYRTLSGRRATVALRGRVASFVAVFRRLLRFFLLALLAGCGGGGDGGDSGIGRRASGDSQPVLGAGGDEEQAEDAPALGFPVFATKNTTRVAGGDSVANAAGAARAVYPARTDESSPRAVVIVEQDDWRAAISAAQLMARPLQAAVLFSDGGELPAASAEALEELAPSGAEEADDAQVIRIGDAAKPENRRWTDDRGREPGLARPGDRRLPDARRRRPDRRGAGRPRGQPASSRCPPPAGPPSPASRCCGRSRTRCRPRPARRSRRTRSRGSTCSARRTRSPPAVVERAGEARHRPSASPARTR